MVMRVWPHARSSYEEGVDRPKQSRQAQSRLEQGVGGCGVEGNPVLRSCKTQILLHGPWMSPFSWNPRHTPTLDTLSCLRFWGEGGSLPKKHAKNSKE